jgi:hypothetical protein
MALTSLAGQHEDLVSYSTHSHIQSSLSCSKVEQRSPYGVCVQRRQKQPGSCAACDRQSERPGQPSHTEALPASALSEGQPVTKASIFCKRGKVRERKGGKEERKRENEKTQKKKPTSNHFSEKLNEKHSSHPPPHNHGPVSSLQSLRFPSH